MFRTDSELDYTEFVSLYSTKNQANQFRLNLKKSAVSYIFNHLKSLEFCQKPVVRFLCVTEAERLCFFQNLVESGVNTSDRL